MTSTTEQESTTKQEGTVATREHTALEIHGGQAFWTEQQLAALAQLGVRGAPSGDLSVFLHYAQRTGLDPFSRQLYMIERQGRWTMQAGIDALRIVAQRSGEYAGQVGPEWCGPDGQWVDVWLHETSPAAARVGVLRRGFTAPLYAVAIFREYAGRKRDGSLSQMWESKGALMIAKCAEALALRKAFPMDLSGIYTAEEMAVADTVTAGAAPLAPTGASEAENTCTADPEQVTQLRVDVLWATSLDDPPTRLRGIWQDAKAIGALACDVAVPAGWRELKAPDGSETPETLPLSALIVVAHTAIREGVEHGEDLPEPAADEPSTEPAADEQSDPGEQCAQTRRADGVRCDRAAGHAGKHHYAETVDGELLCGETDGAGWPCIRPEGHDGDHSSLSADGQTV